MITCSVCLIRDRIGCWTSSFYHVFAASSLLSMGSSGFSLVNFSSIVLTLRSFSLEKNLMNPSTRGMKLQKHDRMMMSSSQFCLKMCSYLKLKMYSYLKLKCPATSNWNVQPPRIENAQKPQILQFHHFDFTELFTRKEGKIGRKKHVINKESTLYY
jgi:hypothetical protein